MLHEASLNILQEFKTRNIELWPVILFPKMYIVNDI